MKLVFCVGFLLALSPLASHAQYGVGGRETAGEHIANQAAIEAASRNNQAADKGGSYSRKGRIMPLIPLFRTPEEKQRRAFNKAKNADKRRNREQDKIDQELQRQREAVRR